VRNVAALGASTVGLLDTSSGAGPFLAASALVPGRTNVPVFAARMWNDYLLWELPAAGQLFQYSQYELVPSERPFHYEHILAMRSAQLQSDGRFLPSWRTLLDRAGVSIVALSAEDDGKQLFAHFLHGEEPGWRIAYVNDTTTALIAVREP